MFRKQINKYIQRMIQPLQQAGDRSLMLQSLLVAQNNFEKQSLSSLDSAEFSVFSQWGEDGVIDWLVRRLRGIPRTFVEFGVENYRESNTRLLLQMHNWRGLVMDGSEDHVNDIRKQDICWRYGLTAKHAFIDRDNINKLLAESGLQGDIGLLSIDIDGNDYWVWDAIDVISPAIVVCEYNAAFGDRYAITVPYQADFQRARAHYSNLYFGASIRALILLGKKKQYTFIGTNSSGCNAFFVRNDYADEIVGSLESVLTYPSRFRESRNEDGNLTLLEGLDRLDVIGQLPVFDVESEVESIISNIRQVYSNEWLSCIPVSILN